MNQEKIMPMSRRSNRPSFRVAENSQKGAETSALPENKGGDSFAVSANPSLVAGQSVRSTPPADMPARSRQLVGAATQPSQPEISKRISHLQLEQLKSRLSDRDFSILREIQRFRFLTSDHVKRLYFTDGISTPANARATNKALKKLREYRLVAPLERRIGGVRAGSSALIWHLTEPGERLLRLDDQGKFPRKRFEEPTQAFLNHTLAIAENSVRIISYVKNLEGTSIKQLDPEPACWRKYRYQGKIVYLKPDIFVVIVSPEYVDHFFIEVDLGTEPPAKILRKCQMYVDYYNTGIEQEKNRVFPLTLWVVSDEQRRNTLEAKIHEKYPPHTKLFRIISAENLEKGLALFLEESYPCAGSEGDQSGPSEVTEDRR